MSRCAFAFLALLSLSSARPGPLRRRDVASTASALSSAAATPTNIGAHVSSPLTTPTPTPAPHTAATASDISKAAAFWGEVASANLVHSMQTSGADAMQKLDADASWVSAFVSAVTSFEGVTTPMPGAVVPSSNTKPETGSPIGNPYAPKSATSVTASPSPSAGTAMVTKPSPGSSSLLSQGTYATPVPTTAASTVPTKPA